MLTCVELVQPVQFNLVEIDQVKHVYVFLETLIAYAQHESLKQVIFFFEHVALIVQTWLQIVDSLTNLRSKYNITKSLLKDTNNQLPPHCLKLVNHKQTL